MNFDDFSYTENGRRYINPQTSLDEQNAFIDNLRNMQTTNTAQITQDTRNLGTQVPSNLGGLTGGTSYFASRYQTPQMNSMVSDLRSAAQANALSTLMSNEVSKAQKRYNDAYRAAKKRASSGGGSGSGLSNMLKALGLTTSNNNKASDLFKLLGGTTEDDLAADPELQIKINAAASNLRNWQETKNRWNRQNVFEQMWSADEGKHADDQITYWQRQLDSLKRAAGK